MKIMKFGGTSVGKPERMHQVESLITRDSDRKIVVLSALSGTTNTLVQIGLCLSKGDKAGAETLVEQLSQHYHQFIDGLLNSQTLREKGRQLMNAHFEFLQIITRISFNEALNKDILAQGELMSTKLFSLYLEEKGIAHALIPALDFMVLDHQDEPDLPQIKAKLNTILSAYPDTPIFVTQGYICKNAKGEVDNLKRGGSDYTASLVAAASQASVCEIWTDIDGMHNNDPRMVDRTIPIEKLSFEEAAELAYFGAKILHPTCIWPAQQENVPVKLLNTMQPDAVGTVIQKDAGSVGVKAIAAKDGIIAINIKSSRMLLAYGFLRKIFEVFEKYRTSIDMITTSEVAVSVTIDDATHLAAIVKELEPFGTIEVWKEQTIVSVVGNEIAQTPQILSTLFHALSTVPITMVSYGGSRHNVTLLVPAAHKLATLRLLNAGLFGLG